MLISAEHFALAGLLFLLITGLGFFITFTYRKRPEHFSWPEYLVLIAVPISLVAFLGLEHDPRVLVFFVLGSLVGTIYEWVIGFAYHRLMGVRLWTYHRFALGGYTSILSIPLWGVGAVLFWLLARALGL